MLIRIKSLSSKTNDSGGCVDSRSCDLVVNRNRNFSPEAGDVGANTRSKQVVVCVVSLSLFCPFAPLALTLLKGLTLLGPSCSFTSFVNEMKLRSLGHEARDTKVWYTEGSRLLTLRGRSAGWFPIIITTIKRKQRAFTLFEPISRHAMHMPGFLKYSVLDFRNVTRKSPCGQEQSKKKMTSKKPPALLARWKRPTLVAGDESHPNARQELMRRD